MIGRCSQRKKKKSGDWKTERWLRLWAKPFEALENCNSPVGKRQTTFHFDPVNFAFRFMRIFNTKTYNLNIIIIRYSVRNIRDNIPLEMPTVLE